MQQMNAIQPSCREDVL